MSMFNFDKLCLLCDRVAADLQPFFTPLIRKYLGDSSIIDAAEAECHKLNGAIAADEIEDFFLYQYCLHAKAAMYKLYTFKP